MKKLNLLKTMLLLCALIVGSMNSVWADETSTLTFTAKCNGSGTADDDVTWTITSDGTESDFEKGENGRGVHYGTSSAQVQYIKLSTSGISGTITKVVANCSTASGVTATVSVTVGGSAFGGDAQTLTTSPTDYTFTGSASGEIIVTVTKPSKATKALYVKSVAVTYEDTSDTRTAVNMTSFTATKTTLLVGETTETTVTNDQAGWTAAYTYESSDDEVATVSEAGVITAVAKGTATITATLNVDADDASYKAGSEKSKSIDITVTKPFHNVTFYRNGAVYETTPVEEGENVVFPANPGTLGGKAFVGWVVAEIDGTTNDEPSFVSSATMSTADQTYYALYATVSDVTDELIRATTGVTGTSYTDWSGKTDASGAVYAGQSAGGNESIQLRSSNSNSGIVTTTSGGKVKKIVVEWNSNTSNGRTIDIYGKNSAYTAATDLYDSSKQGTKLGSIANGSTELTIDGDYEYIGIRSNSGALYLNKISITWKIGSVSYSDYCTTVKETATVGDAGYATYVTKSDVEFAANDAYAVTIVDGKAVLNAVTKVPAGTAVLLKGSGEKAASVLNETPADVTNDLMASNGTITGDNATIYVLANINNKVGFYLLDSSVTIPAGKAYLQTANGNARQFIGLDDESTGISATLVSGEKANNDVYDLSGRKIVNGKSVNGKLQRGLYIVNGKKVVVR